MSDPGPAFSVEVSPPVDGGVATVRVAGEIDIATVDLLAAALDPLVEAGATEIVLDMAEVLFIDSSGLAVLAGLAARGTKVAIRHASEILERIVKTTGLDEVLELRP